MTSPVATPPPPPPPPPPVPTASGGAPALTGATTAGAPTPSVTTRARELFSGAVAGTPGRMRVLGAVAIVACLAFGVIAFLAVQRLHSNVEDARRNAEQLVRIQSIRTNLVKADANATNAFLVGGLEPPAVRDAYTDGITTTARTLAEASGARTDDASALQRVNRVLTEYTGLIEAARANNRQGFPVGAAYLRQASTVLRDDALPALARLVTVEQRRVEKSIDAAASTRDALILLLVVAAAALLVAQVYLSKKTKRTFNKPLVYATAVVVASGLLGLLVVAWSTDEASDARDGPYRETVALATARIGGFDAKSAEALTLIARGSGAPFEARFQTTSQEASDALAAELSDASFTSAGGTRAAFTEYVAAHEALRSLDDGGKHDEAVAAATGDGPANRAFTEFERASSRALTSAASDLSDDLRTAATPLIVAAWLLLLAGLAAAVLAWRGISERLREYR